MYKSVACDRTSASNYNSPSMALPQRPAPAEHRLTVPTDAAGQRLDQTLAQLLPHHSRSRLKGWIEAGLVQVGGAVVGVPKHKLAGGEALLVVEGAGVHDETVEAQAMALRIPFEDDTLLVIDKPAGLV